MTQAALFDALHQPGIYPETSTRVEVHETHISVVFVTDHYAYKIKKSLDLGFLDYSTLVQRHLACQQELLLNRRLSTDVYHDVVPIYQEGPHYTFQQSGTIVEYAVKMRRLAPDSTLEALLHQGEVSPAAIDALAHLLATFHQNASVPDPAEPFGTLGQVQADWQENFRQTAAWLGKTIPQGLYTQIHTMVDHFIAVHDAWFAQRYDDGRIRDCHGDLRAEHVYFTPQGTQIIDCIEFNKRFRFIDVASEVAFLVMDMERLGAPTLAQDFMRAYVQHSGDVTLYRLLDFYCCYRAYVRGKVASMHHRAAPTSVANEPVPDAVTQYVTLAARYAARCARPLLLMTTGLIGSGKSSLATEIARALDMHLLSSDQMRKQRAGLDLTTPQQVDYGTELYSATASKQLYTVLAGLASNALCRGHTVIVDASFSKRAERQHMAAVARAAGADCLLLECVASLATLRARLEQRQHTPNTISDGRWDIFWQFQQDYEPVSDSEGIPCIRLDTTEPLTSCVSHALAAIWAGRL